MAAVPSRPTDAPRARPPDSSRARWTLVVPVKGAMGKSRLSVADERTRARLAVAFALDALGAAGRVETVARIIVVTPDPDLAARLPASRVAVVAEPGGGLNAAVAAGLAHCDPEAPVAALLADLPALTPGELEHALTLAAAHPLAFVPDADGTGTTLAAAVRAGRLVPRFGPGSAAAYSAAGHALIALPATSPLRRDVDSAADLRAAISLGVGANTAAVLAGVPEPDGIGRDRR